MDKIRAIKDKYPEFSNNELISNLDNYHKNIKKLQDDVFDANAKLQQLESKCTTTEKSVSMEKQLLDERLEKLAECKEILRELGEEKNHLLQEVHQLVTQKTSMENSKPNPKDQHTLEQGRKKFEYYKRLTGIRWDYGAPKEVAKGYVTNGKDYIHSFEYKTHKYGSKLPDVLWKEIAKATGRLELAETDENKVPNY